MNYVANCSFGKDSLAMVLLLLEKELPLTEVIFFDTGMEFQAIYRNRDKLIPLLRERGVKYTELKPDRPFLYDMLEKPVTSKKNSTHYGYGWCGGVCRWGTSNKTRISERYLSQYGNNVTEYVGIAYDEPDRIKEKNYPLVEYKMTEKDCLKFCRDRGWDWCEGHIDLYDILDRVSCWCCANKNKKELYNIFLYLPSYWNKLKELQSQISKPMKTYKSKKHGEYGNLFAMEKIFIQKRSEWLDKLLA